MSTFFNFMKLQYPYHHTVERTINYLKPELNCLRKSYLTKIDRFIVKYGAFYTDNILIKTRQMFYLQTVLAKLL